MSFELTSAEIAQTCGGRLIKGRGSEFVKFFSIDSRTIKKGECFLALKGTRFDGHDFIPEAIKKGAQGVIYQARILKKTPSFREAQFLIEVPDSYKAISDLAKYKRNKFNFQIIGVTGSNGKTTVKELCAELLNIEFPTYKNYLNQNNLLGLSLNILNCCREYKFAVFEIGISGINEMDELLEILRPDHGLITNISPTHIQFLKKVSTVYREKIKLFKSLRPNGYAFYSLDDRWLSNLKREDFQCKNFRTFGFSRKNDFWAEVKSFSLCGTEMRILNKENLKAYLLGKQNAFNIIAAICVASEFGVDFKNITKVLSEFRPPPGRMNRLALPGIDIIDDGYNSNPVSLISALEFLSDLKYQGLKIAILGDMLELGRESKRLHYKCGLKSARFNIDYYFCYGDEMHYFVAGLLNNGFSHHRVYYLEPEEIPTTILGLLTADVKALLLFKASRNMKVEFILENFKAQLSL